MSNDTHPMPPLDAAQAIIDARARATAGEWTTLVEIKDRPINHKDTPMVVSGDWVIADVFGGSKRGANTEFIALSANHAAAVAQAYIDAMQDNARLRAALVMARHEVEDRVAAFRNETLLAAIDAALEDEK
jgi:hypothetical protein